MTLSKPSPVMAIYKFTLSSGINDTDFLQASEKVQAFLSAQSGFQYRSIAKTESNEWLDVNYWNDRSLLSELDEAFNNHKDCQAFLSMINLETMSVNRAQVLYPTVAEVAA
jgi:hypothetical protein